MRTDEIRNFSVSHFGTWLPEIEEPSINESGTWSFYFFPQPLSSGQESEESDLFGDLYPISTGATRWIPATVNALLHNSLQKFWQREQLILSSIAREPFSPLAQPFQTRALWRSNDPAAMLLRMTQTFSAPVTCDLIRYGRTVAGKAEHFVPSLFWPIAVGNLSTKTSSAEILRQFYTLRNESEIINFTDDRPHLSAVLLEAFGKINEYFGYGVELILELTTDPDDEEARDLFVRIVPTVPFKDALQLLDKLDADWWLDISGRVHDLNITLEAV